MAELPGVRALPDFSALSATRRAADLSATASTPGFCRVRRAAEMGVSCSLERSVERTARRPLRASRVGSGALDARSGSREAAVKAACKRLCSVASACAGP